MQISHHSAEKSEAILPGMPSIILLAIIRADKAETEFLENSAEVKICKGHIYL